MTARDVCRRALATLLAHQHVPPRDTEIQEVWPIERSTDGPETLHSTLKHIGQEKDRQQEAHRWLHRVQVLQAKQIISCFSSSREVTIVAKDYWNSMANLVDITLSLWPTS